MIYLHTGVPGAGKTLLTLYLVEQERVRSLSDPAFKDFPEGRPVFYHNIKGLQLPGWIEMVDPLKWYELPVGSMIVMDEAQDLFRPRHYGSNVPEHVAQLEKHRHRGHDLWLITQSPALVDTNVRNLVGTHRHVMRTFGMKRAVMHEWANGVKLNPGMQGARSMSTKIHMRYPREVFGWYKSAELHTHKARIPARVFLMFGAVIAAVVGAGIFGRHMWQRTHAPVQAEGATVGGLQVKGGAGVHEANWLSKPDYFESRTARIPGLPGTAPAYDEVSKPSIAPKPVVAIASAKECRLYTQQGTRIQGASQLLCRQILENGYFDDSPDKHESTWSGNDHEGGGHVDVAQATPGTPEPRPPILAPVSASAVPLSAIEPTIIHDAAPRALSHVR